MRTTLQFDMRAPPFGTPIKELYAAALEMAAYADKIGISALNVMEHHGSADGYIPTPFILGSGFAAVTKKCKISLGAVILPLHDPVKVAEQIAVLDVMSGGRLEVCLGAGYVASEFAMFRRSLRDRGRALDEGIDIILRALNGERFEAGGRELFVRPLPIQKPEDIPLVGGGAPASAKRAARFGLGLMPMHNGILELYDDECRKLGGEPGRKLASGGFGDVYLTYDGDEAWATILPHLRHHVTEYAKFAASAGADTPFKNMLTSDEALKASGMIVVCTPEELLARAKKAHPLGGVTFMPLIGGLSPQFSWKSLRLLENIMPELQAIQPIGSKWELS